MSRPDSTFVTIQARSLWQSHRLNLKHSAVDFRDDNHCYGCLQSLPSHSRPPNIALMLLDPAPPPGDGRQNCRWPHHPKGPGQARPRHATLLSDLSGCRQGELRETSGMESKSLVKRMQRWVTFGRRGSLTDPCPQPGPFLHRSGAIFHNFALRSLHRQVHDLLCYQRSVLPAERDADPADQPERKERGDCCQIRPS